MHRLAIFCCLLAGVLGHPTEAIPGETVTINLKLDHFSEHSDVFPMSFNVYDQYFQPGGPIIISLSRQPAHGISNSLFEDMSKELHAYFIESDTRLFQKNVDIDVRYMTVAQILADFHAIIQDRKDTVSGLESSKVMVIGRYDRGSIASWLRQKYPDTVSGAWAAEAPVEARLTAEEYLESVGEMIKRHGSDECYNRIHTAFEDMKVLFAKKQGNTLKEPFNLCSDIETPEDAKAFFTIVVEMISQHQVWHPRSIKEICEKMTDTSMDAISAFAKVMKIVRGGSSSCQKSSYQDAMECFRTFGKKIHYVMCNEVGTFKTTVSSNHPFSAGLDAAWYAKLCSDAYGSGFTLEDITKKIDDFNKMFGGKHPSVTNVYYTTGEYSPFKSQAITEDLSDTVKAYVDQGAERAFVFQSLSNFDGSEALMQASREGLQLIRNWVH